MNSIDGIIKKVLYHKPSKWSPAGVPYLIAVLHNETVVKGELRKPLLGERYRFYGESKPDRKYPDRDSFEFSSHEVLIDQSADGVTQYLAAHVTGVGRRRAAAIVDHFGADTLHVLRTTPGRAVEAPGITREVADLIASHFEDDCRVDPAAYARLVELFADFHLPKKVLNKLLMDWGSDAPEKVTENPYILVNYPRMSWENVDSFATTKAGYALDGIERHKAAILEALERIANEGHTVAQMVEVEEAAFRLIGGRVKPVAWVALADENRVAEVNPDAPGGEPRLYSLPKIQAAERLIAKRLAELAEYANPLELPGPVEGLNDDQQAAVHFLLDHGVCILCGPPGVGKTHVISRFLRDVVLGDVLGSIKVVAPTGKASKRAAEFLGERSALGLRAAAIPCTTIHRALAPTPSDAEEGVPSADARAGRGRDEFGFGHNRGNPIDVELLICDEASMLDVRLAASLLDAIPLGTRVVFVGDPNQLPSVGPGSFLRDMIAAGIPTATLTKIVRSDGGGRVVRACHAIKDGRMPEPADRMELPTENWRHFEASDPGEIARTIVELHAKIQAGSKNNLDPMWDMQVVSAQSGRHAFGCANLNALLSEQLNPLKPGEPSLLGGGGGGGEAGEDGPRIPFRVGDKVVRTKNGLVDEMLPSTDHPDDRVDWRWLEHPDDTCPPEFDEGKWSFRETTVVNGDMGTVLDMVPHDRGVWVVVRFRNPDRLCRLAFGECHLIQAYAITVHKCVHPETLVEIEDGLLPIRSIARQGVIATPGGPKPYLNFVSNPPSDSLRIGTKDGYSITITRDHKVEFWDGTQFIMTEADMVKTGMIMRLKLGVTIDPAGPCPLPPMPRGDIRSIVHRVPSEATEDVAEFMGLMVADGTLYDRGFRLVKRHFEVVHRFGELCRLLFGVEPTFLDHPTNPGFEVNSALLADWLRSIGGMSPNAKDVPECILRSKASIQAKFLRGLFEDGGSNLNDDDHLDHIEFSSVYPDLRDKVRVMLLRFSIISGITPNRPEAMYLYGSNALRFAHSIGFITPDKQNRALTGTDSERRYKIPISKAEILPIRQFIGQRSFSKSIYVHCLQRGYLSRESAKAILAESLLPGEFLGIVRDRMGYHFSEVVSVKEVVCPSMCVEVPDGHRFLQNGFPFGNSQGSGFPYTIVPVHSSFFWDGRSNTGLWCRELVYTAISRAERILVTVGEMASIRTAIGRKTVDHRKTRLVERIRAAARVTVEEVTA